MKRPRLRKWAKWTCTVAAGVLAVTWVLTRWFAVMLIAGHCFATVRHGAVDVACYRAKFATDIYVGRTPDAMLMEPEDARDRWVFGFKRVSGEAYTHVRVPMWPVVLLTMGAALLAHRRATREADRCGSCGYDRRGLAADAKCPECGTVPAPKWPCVGSVRCGGGAIGRRV